MLNVFLVFLTSHRNDRFDLRLRSLISVQISPSTNMYFRYGGEFIMCVCFFHLGPVMACDGLKTCVFKGVCPTFCSVHAGIGASHAGYAG